MDIKRLAHRTADFNFLRMHPIAIHLLMTLVHSRVFDGLPPPRLPLMLYTICGVIIASHPLRLPRAAASRVHELEYIESACARAMLPALWNSRRSSRMRTSWTKGLRTIYPANWVQTLLALAGSASAYTLLDYFQLG